MNYGFDVNVEERPLSDDEKVRKDVTTSDLERFTLLEEVSLRQKSRPLWLREGDKNTNFSTVWLICIERRTLWNR
jgi:hypothetical protein